VGTSCSRPGRGATGAATLRHSAATEAILCLAATQHGVVTRAQLLAVGVPPDTVDRRIACKLLVPLHRGVYAVGLPVSVRGRALAALFACGADAAVSHQTAAGLLRFFPADSANGHVHVILARGDRRRSGIRIHRIRDIRPDEVTTLDQIRQTTPARTLLDLAATVAARDLEKATVEALGMRLTTPAELGEMVRRHPAHRGSGRLRALLGTSDSIVTRSEAERAFLALVRRAGIHVPETNATVAGFEVDAVWHREKLIVEIDGKAFHSTSGRIAADRRRDFALAAAGYRVIRVTWHQLVRTPEALLVQLTRALLGDAGR
jgi:very-short-patch-repair endonuclease